MKNAMLHTFYEILPVGAEKAFIPIGGAVGGMLSFAFGNVGPLLIWLTIFVVADIITGWLAARAQGVWKSSKFFVGMLKKAVMFAIVALSHGLDQLFSPLIGVAIFQSITICAYAAGEFGSILENLERAGLGSAIPPILRRLVSAVNHKLEDTVDKIGGEHNDGKE